MDNYVKYECLSCGITFSIVFNDKQKKVSCLSCGSIEVEKLDFFSYENGSENENEIKQRKALKINDYLVKLLNIDNLDKQSIFYLSQEIPKNSEYRNALMFFQYLNSDFEKIITRQSLIHFSGKNSDFIDGILKWYVNKGFLIKIDIGKYKLNLNYFPPFKPEPEPEKEPKALTIKPVKPNKEKEEYFDLMKQYRLTIKQAKYFDAILKITEGNPDKYFTTIDVSKETDRLPTELSGIIKAFEKKKLIIKKGKENLTYLYSLNPNIFKINEEKPNEQNE